MTPEQRRYLRVEMAVAAAINAVLSVAFLFAVFGGRESVPVWGWTGLVADAAPQSLMIALMSVLVPTLLTRSRVAAGTVAPLTGRNGLPRNVLARALAVTIPVAIVAVALHAALLPLTGATWRFATAGVFKTIYGALLGVVVARVAVIAALGDIRAIRR